MGTQQLLSFINFETRKNSAPDHSYHDHTSRSFDTFLDFHQISADKVFIAQLLCLVRQHALIGWICIPGDVEIIVEAKV